MYLSQDMFKPIAASKIDNDIKNFDGYIDVFGNFYKVKTRQAIEVIGSENIFEIYAKNYLNNQEGDSSCVGSAAKYLIQSYKWCLYTFNQGVDVAQVDCAKDALSNTQMTLAQKITLARLYKINNDEMVSINNCLRLTYSERQKISDIDKHEASMILNKSTLEIEKNENEAVPKNIDESKVMLFGEVKVYPDEYISSYTYKNNFSNSNSARRRRRNKISRNSNSDNNSDTNILDISSIRMTATAQPLMTNMLSFLGNDVFIGSETGEPYVVQLKVGKTVKFSIMIFADNVCDAKNRIIRAIIAIKEKISKSDIYTKYYGLRMNEIINDLNEYGLTIRKYNKSYITTAVYNDYNRFLV